jgi:sporulation protein YlmC with PRC-barrel domain
MQLFHITFVLAAFLWVGVARPTVAAPDVAFPLFTMENIIGHAVETPQGEGVGDIADVIIDAATGEVPYVVLAAGGVLKLGDKLVTLPWWGLRLEDAAKPFRLQISLEQLRKAPGFSREEWPDMEARHWRDAIHAYYGQPPYEGQHLPPEVPRTAIEQAQLPRRFLKASYVLQSQVINPRGQRLGDIEEVVVDATAGTVTYTVLEFGGVLGLGTKWFALPWQALRQGEGLGTFTLDVDPEVFREAPGFDKDRWPQQAQELRLPVK